MITNQIKQTLLKSIKANPTKLMMLFVLFILANTSFALDALVDAEPIVKDTYNGSIKTYLYIGEAVAAITTLIFTRNIKTLGAVGGVAIFFHVVAALVGA